jgi:SAM-dependent methyltransferase
MPFGIHQSAAEREHPNSGALSMQSPFTITIGLILAILVVALVWRFFSNRRAIPCPSWLGWMVEMDNPILKNNSAREILSHLELQPGMQVLDFGCGPGRLTIPSARQVAPGGSVTAFDIQAGMLERVRVRAALEKLENIVFVQGTTGEGKLGYNKYDRALLVTVLGEVPDRKTLMKEIYDSLKPGGCLSVTEAIADPHFQRRSAVEESARAAGVFEKSFFGHGISFTVIFEKPRIVASE